MFKRCAIVGLLLLAGFTHAQALGRDPKPGVAKDLAVMRKACIASPFYRLKVSIPALKSEPIAASLDLSFEFNATVQDLILDFTPGAGSIRVLQLNGQSCNWRYVNGHIIIPARQARLGTNRLRIDFNMGEMSLNRREDLLYTLFVPDRARTAFPCFDQPDLKGRFEVELDIPKDWDGLANGPLLASEAEIPGRQRLRFAPSHPLPTYLMAFAAGKLQRVEETRGGRRVQLFHQEHDPAVLQRNLTTIFDQVFSSLAWMERYTGVPYPFDKYDLVLVPSFQYGGMEHCGATLYRASHLLLDEGATLEQQLSRASLIAHETAHMWFGDLVTMPWFDEVWLKEVYAGFMADKMVGELFPQIDHRLRFMLAHTPPSLAVDRSAGTHPITQSLDNLSDAGTVYGNLIYHKAPIVMDQLERRVGPQALQLALGRYLRENAYGNAGWDPLIDLLAKGDPGLKAWSRGWVYEAGLPTVTMLRKEGRLHLMQRDERNQKRLWSQKLGLAVVKGDAHTAMEIDLWAANQDLALPEAWTDPDLVLPAGNGVGYGRFLLDMRGYALLLADPMMLQQALWRGSAWLTLWEGALDGHVRPAQLMKTALGWMEREDNPLLLEKILGDLPTLYWRLLDPVERETFGADCEDRIWAEMMRRPAERRMAFFDAFQRLTVTTRAQLRLAAILRGEEKIEGITLSEQKELDLLITLGLHRPEGFDALLADVPLDWKSQDRRKQLFFLTPLFSPKPDDWRRFFRETLTQAENREQEPWVLRALALINHPLRAETTRELIPEVLGLLPEIQRTGDIFFPIGWVGESLWGHQSPEAAALVRGFLDRDKTLSTPLRLKVLQGADYLLRGNHSSLQHIKQVVHTLSSLPQPRNVQHPDMLEKAANFIEETWRGQGWRVKREPVPFQGGEARNVSILWGRVQDPRLVIGAHYDVCGQTPGADDNASGIAVIVELAAMLKSREPISGLAVELVAYALEEPPYFGSPLMGSFVHAHRLRQDKVAVDLMISVDMVGYYADARSFLGVIGREEDQAILEKVAGVMADETMLGVRALPFPESQKGLDWSDHRNFWIHGFPALLVHSCPFFQNPHYHRPGDRLEILDTHRILALTRALFKLILGWTE
jgi:aminopeptidase N